jgi:hypothetical protein
MGDRSTAEPSSQRIAENFCGASLIINGISQKEPAATGVIGKEIDFMIFTCEKVDVLKAERSAVGNDRIDKKTGCAFSPLAGDYVER